MEGILLAAIALIGVIITAASTIIVAMITRQDKRLSDIHILVNGRLQAALDEIVNLKVRVELLLEAERAKLAADDTPSK